MRLFPGLSGKRNLKNWFYLIGQLWTCPVRDGSRSVTASFFQGGAKAVVFSTALDGQQI